MERLKVTRLGNRYIPMMARMIFLRQGRKTPVEGRRVGPGTYRSIALASDIECIPLAAIFFCEVGSKTICPDQV